MLIFLSGNRPLKTVFETQKVAVRTSLAQNTNNTGKLVAMDVAESAMDFNTF